MNSLRYLSIALVTGLLTSMLPGCVVPDGGYGYGYDDGMDIGPDYYEPYGVFYDGWEPGYRVGPFPDGGHRPDHDGGHPPGHDGGHPPGHDGGHNPDQGGHPQPPAYKPAPESHPMPSIPTRPRPRNVRPH